MNNCGRKWGIVLAALALVALLTAPAAAAGLNNLPKAKWSASGKQPGLKGDMVDIERAILESFELRSMPQPTWVDATEVRIIATADSPARILMAGFPDVVHPGQILPAGLTDGKYRANTSNVSMDFDVGTNRWGSEKASQYYAIFALAGTSDTTFTLKAMPYCRVDTQATQTISLGTNLTPATGIDYVFTNNEFQNGKIYVLSGASRGLLRTISANDVSGGASRITYSGTALTLAEGDWFIILPPGTNFCWIGDIFNNASSNIGGVDDVIFGKPLYFFNTPGTTNWLCPFTWNRLITSGIAGGGGSDGDPAVYGNPGAKTVKAEKIPTPGTLYTITIGAGGSQAGPTAGGSTSLGSLLSLSGGGTAGAAVLLAQGLWGYGYGGDAAGGDGGPGFLLIERGN